MKINQLALLLSVIILGSCNKNNKQQAMGAQGPEAYSVLTVQPQEITLYREFPATLQGQQDLEIRPKVDGFIEHIYVKEGDQVKRGQLLFSIFNPSYAQSVASIDASIKSAQAEVRTAEIELKNTKELVDRKVVGDFQYKTQQNALESKKQVLNQLRADQSTQKTNAGYTKITAPADGVIGTIPYKVGALVSSSSPEALTTFSNSSNILAYFSVSEQDLLKYNNDLGSDAYLKLSNDSVLSARGTVEKASGILATQTGTVTYKASFANTGNALKSGGFATVKIPYPISQVIVVPQSATYEVQDKRYVFVVDKSNKITSRMITATATNDGQFFIVNSGIKAGETIAITGVGISLKDDMTIKPQVAKSEEVFKNLTTSN